MKDLVENMTLYKTAYEKLDTESISIVEKVRTSYYAMITIDGTAYSAVDLKETLEAVKAEDIYITNTEMVAMLKKYGAIAHGGSNRSSIGAESGPGYDEFMAMLDEKMQLCEHYERLVE